MNLPSCSYVALYELCKAHPKFNDQSFQAFLESTRKFRHLEYERWNAYKLFTEYNIDVPSSIEFQNKTQLVNSLKFPCVVKFENNTTIGTQTLVVDSQEKCKDLYKQAQHIDRGIIQQYISGYEFTVTLLVGSKNWILIGTAQDHKRQYDNDVGLNTFGLGSTAPFTIPDKTHEIIDKVVSALVERYSYVGFLSCQFIVDSRVWLMECNVRICDPEFQSMSELLDFSLYDQILACINGEYLIPLELNHLNAVTLSLVHRDWPNAVQREDINFPKNTFKIYKNPGSWDNGTYYGSITNSGHRSHADLFKEIYNFLKVVDTAPYRYRTDLIKKLQNQ